MAGFAIFMAIVTYGFLALVTACVSSLLLFFFAKRRVPNEARSRRQVIAVTAMAPFLALLWLVAAFLIHIQISNKVAHQDCGLSPDPYVTLPNGYILGSHNTYDGYFKAPGYETGAPVAGPGYVRSIINLKFFNEQFTGTQFDFNTSSVRRFLFDTRTRKFQSSPDGPLTWDAANAGAQQSAAPYWKLYAQYRHLWPNYVFVVLIIAGEGAIGFWVWKLWAPSLLNSDLNQKDSAVTG